MLLLVAQQGPTRELPPGRALCIPGPFAELLLPAGQVTAQAERALSYWPNKGEEDVRPAVGEAYRKLQPVAPKNPVVPADAPAALRLPIVGVS